MLVNPRWLPKRPLLYVIIHIDTYCRLQAWLSNTSMVVERKHVFPARTCLRSRALKYILVFSAINITGMVGGNYYWYGRR